MGGKLVPEDSLTAYQISRSIFAFENWNIVTKILLWEGNICIFPNSVGAAYIVSDYLISPSIMNKDI